MNPAFPAFHLTTGGKLSLEPKRVERFCHVHRGVFIGALHQVVCNDCRATPEGRAYLESRNSRIRRRLYLRTGK